MAITASLLYDLVQCPHRVTMDVFGNPADRDSISPFVELLWAAAYVLVETLRRVGLAGTELASAQVGTIRLKLLKIGGRIVRSVRRLVIHLASGYPMQRTFQAVLRRLQNWRNLPLPAP